MSFCKRKTFPPELSSKIERPPQLRESGKEDSAFPLHFLPPKGDLYPKVFSLNTECGALVGLLEMGARSVLQMKRILLTEHRGK